MDLAEFSLTIENAIVIGSGVMQALGLRASADIDVIVNAPAYARFREDARFRKGETHGRETLNFESLEVGTYWDVLGRRYDFKDLCEHSLVIGSTRYITPEFLLQVKRSWVAEGARPKDLADIALLTHYLGKSG